MQLWAFILLTIVSILIIDFKDHIPDKSPTYGGATSAKNTEKILIIVPYGNLDPKQQRDKQLTAFLKHFDKLLEKKQKVDVDIIVGEQISPKKFNKGRVLNHALMQYITNFKKDIKNIKKIIFNDVDLLPDAQMFSDVYFDFDSDVHSMLPLKSEQSRKVYSEGVPLGGGIVGFTFEAFGQINGFPNSFWGWGGEDNEVYLRIKILNNKIDCADESPSELWMNLCDFIKSQKSKNSNGKILRIAWNDSSTHSFKSNDIRRVSNGDETAEINKRKYVFSNAQQNEAHSSTLIPNTDGIKQVLYLKDKVSIVDDIKYKPLNYRLFWYRVDMNWNVESCAEFKRNMKVQKNQAQKGK